MFELITYIMRLKHNYKLMNPEEVLTLYGVENAKEVDLGIKVIWNDIPDKYKELILEIKPILDLIGYKLHIETISDNNDNNNNDNNNHHNNDNNAINNDINNNINKEEKTMTRNNQTNNNNNNQKMNKIQYIRGVIKSFIKNEVGFNELEVINEVNPWYNRFYKILQDFLKEWENSVKNKKWDNFNKMFNDFKQYKLPNYVNYLNSFANEIEYSNTDEPIPQTILSSYNTYINYVKDVLKKIQEEKFITKITYNFLEEYYNKMITVINFLKIYIKDNNLIQNGKLISEKQETKKDNDDNGSKDNNGFNNNSRKQELTTYKPKFRTNNKIENKNQETIETKIETKVDTKNEIENEQEINEQEMIVVDTIIENDMQSENIQSENIQLEENIKEESIKMDDNDVITEIEGYSYIPENEEKENEEKENIDIEIPTTQNEILKEEQIIPQLQEVPQLSNPQLSNPQLSNNENQKEDKITSTHHHLFDAQDGDELLNKIISYISQKETNENYTFENKKNFNITTTFISEIIKFIYDGDYFVTGLLKNYFDKYLIQFDLPLEKDDSIIYKSSFLYSTFIKMKSTISSIYKELKNKKGFDFGKIKKYAETFLSNSNGEIIPYQKRLLDIVKNNKVFYISQYELINNIIPYDKRKFIAVKHVYLVLYKFLNSTYDTMYQLGTKVYNLHILITELSKKIVKIDENNKDDISKIEKEIRTQIPILYNLLNDIKILTYNIELQLSKYINNFINNFGMFDGIFEKKVNPAKEKIETNPLFLKLKEELDLIEVDDDEEGMIKNYIYSFIRRQKCYKYDYIGSFNDLNIHKIFFQLLNNYENFPPFILDLFFNTKNLSKLNLLRWIEKYEEYFNKYYGTLSSDYKPEEIEVIKETFALYRKIFDYFANNLQSIDGKVLDDLRKQLTSLIRRVNNQNEGVE